MLGANWQVDELLDQVGRLVLRAAAANDAETEAAASAPFLYTRLRATIAEERARRDETGGWRSLLFVARRAVPGMALIAVLAAILTLWPAPLSAPTTLARFDDDVIFETRETGLEQTILANRNGLSRDEVFSLVVDRNGGRSVK
jgi:hypothetical protein